MIFISRHSTYHLVKVGPERGGQLGLDEHRGGGEQEGRGHHRHHGRRRSSDGWDPHSLVVFVVPER